MISRLAGILQEADLTDVVVDVNGVGYALSVPMSTFDKLPALGQPVVLHTHLNVREDAMQLFGFATVPERRLFRLLITISGIGPRLALNVLSCMPIASFCSTVASGDVKALSRINGVGKRTAERLIVELREKVVDLDPTAGLNAAAGPGAASQEASDAVAALETLGFKADLARKAVDAVLAEQPGSPGTAENLIRKALQRLNS